MTWSQVAILFALMAVVTVATVALVGWIAVRLVQEISTSVSRTLATSFQTVTSPGVAPQPTETWQTVTTVPWEDWERPVGEETLPE